MSEKSLQETYAPNSICFGCGPANAQGLHIRSFVHRSERGDEVVTEWQPQPHHQAFAGALSGGIIGALMDCHSNWAAAWHLMQHQGLDRVPPTVTAEYTVKMLRPTPTDAPVKLIARVVESQADRATVETELIAKGRVCATGRGVFVAVKPGHPAYHRWE
jgi:acyl-coenzyme A thioesterase PaaI-like protein